MWFLSVPSNEVIVEGKAVLGCQRCLSLLQGGIADILSERGLATWFERMTKCIHADGVILKNWTRQEIHTCTQILVPSNFWGHQFNSSDVKCWYEQIMIDTIWIVIMKHNNSRNWTKCIKCWLHQMLNVILIQNMFMFSGCYQVSWSTGGEQWRSTQQSNKCWLVMLDLELHGFHTEANML